MTDVPRVLEPLSAVEQAAFEIVEAVIRRALVGGPPGRDLTIEFAAGGLVYVRAGIGKERSARAWVAGPGLGEAVEYARAVLPRG